MLGLIIIYFIMSYVYWFMKVLKKYYNIDMRASIVVIKIEIMKNNQEKTKTSIIFLIK